MNQQQHSMTRSRVAQVQSKVMWGICCACATLILIALASVLAFLIVRGVGGLSWSFFTQEFVPEGVAGYPGGMFHALVGTLVLLAMASLVGVPVGVMAGIFLSEYSDESRLATFVRFIADVLTGVPSIVVGILGYELFVVPFSTGEVVGIPVPWLRGFGGIMSFNAYAGALALAFIMIPIVARTTEEMLRLVPGSYREASIALGATKAHTIFRVVLPAATGPTLTGVMLALARVAGETAPLLFTAFGAREISRTNPLADLNHGFPSLTLQIFSHITGRQEARDLAWTGVLVLVILIFAVNFAVRVVSKAKG